jgi:hypothetical protein
MLGPGDSYATIAIGRKNSTASSNSRKTETSPQQEFFRTYLIRSRDPPEISGVECLNDLRN